MKKPKELMKPRWKIIADFPYNTFGEVGDILDRDWGWSGDDEKGFKHHVSQYPHLFKKLEWWEERNPEDMPEYVKHTASGKIWKVKEYDLPTGAHITGPEVSTYWAVMKNLEPATEADYNAYLQTLTVK